MKTMKQILSMILAMILVVALASCGTDKNEPSESADNTQNEVVTTDPSIEETENPSEETTGYENLETNETEDRLGWVVSGDYGAVNMFLDIDGSVYWIYDTEKNPRYTAMMQDYIKNHTNEEIMEYAVSLGIDPSIYLNTDESNGSEAPAIVGKSAFDAAGEWYYDVIEQLEVSYANRTYRDQTAYRYDSWSNTVIAEDQRIYNPMKPVEVEFNDYFMLEPGWYYTYYTDDNGSIWQFWYGIQEPDDGKYEAIYSAAEDKHPEVHQGSCQYATVGITEPEFDWIHSYNVQDAVIVNLSEQTVSLATYFSNGDGSYNGQYVHYGVDELIYYGPTLNYDDIGEIGRALYANS